MRFACIELIQTFFEESSSELKHTRSKLFREMIKEESNELESQLGDFDVIAAKNDNHKLFHAYELIGVGFDDQFLSSFFSEWVGRGVNQYHFSFNEFMFFIDFEETIFEELELSTSDIYKLFFLLEVLVEKFYDVFTAYLG